MARKAITVNDRTITVDFTKVKPFTVLGTTQEVEYKTTLQLYEAIQGYFDSCLGPVYGKYGILLDEHGEPIKRQIVDYTIPGLCHYLGISAETLEAYHLGMDKKGNRFPKSFIYLVNQAFLLIENNCIQNLANKESAPGAEFILKSIFNYETPREKAQTRKTKVNIGLSRQKLRLEKLLTDAKLSTYNKFNEDTDISITIKRKED